MRRDGRRRLVLSLGVLTLLMSALLGLGSAGALAAPVDIMVGCDNGVGDVPGLIAAINAANAAGGGTIILTDSCVYTLTTVDNNDPTHDANGLPEITGDVTIESLVEPATISRASADGTPAFRLFDVVAGGSLTLNDLTLSNGDSPTDIGGGILVDGGSLTLTKTTLSGNSADLGGGVGVASGIATVTDTTISGNSTSGDNVKDCSPIFNGGGDGIFILSGTVTMTNATISGNRGTSGVGGIYVLGGTVALTNITVSNNDGNGLVTYGGMTTLTNSIIANAIGDTNCFGDFTFLTDGGYNLDSDGTCRFTQPTSHIVDANHTLSLGPLADNGGPTQTMRPSADSTGAIDQIPPASCAVTTDQRGISRPQPVGGNCDIGAVELDQTPPTISISTTATADSTTGWYNIASSGTSGIPVNVHASIPATMGAIGSVTCTDTTGSGTTTPVDLDFSRSIPLGVQVILTLTDGDHQFSCTDTNVDGVATQTPASQEFKIDQTAPSITFQVNGQPVSDGWYNLANSPSGVSVQVASSDTTSGVRAIVCSDTVGGSTSTVLDTTGANDPSQGSFSLTDGVHALSCTSTDVAGNPSTKTATVQVDRTAPAVPTLLINGQAPLQSGWYNLANSPRGVTVQVSSSDATSGIGSLVCTDTAGGTPTTVLDTSGTADPSQGTFSLGDGIHQLSCVATDLAGNASNATTATAQVDLTAPTISLTTPQDGAVYSPDQVVDAAYSCDDATSGIVQNGCVGTVPSGSPIDTSTVGNHDFSVTATDNAGNTATQTISYTVGNTIKVLSSQTTPVRRPSWAVLKLEVVDGQGHNLSSRSLTVTALNLAPLGQPWDGTNGNLVRPFTYSPALAPGGAYELLVGTASLRPGTYVLSFQVEGDPSIHTLQFVVR